MSRSICITFLVIVVFGCATPAMLVPPAGKGTPYPCGYFGVSCRPFDGSATCCPENHRCGMLSGEPSCSYEGNPDNGSNGAIGAAQKSVPRTPESGRP
jgi:hypothetical protein